jgi:RNA polymerase sigma-70 factor, ECF subfamily
MIDAEEFESHRPRLFALAYRMLGSATEAEDVVQDAWLRCSAARPPDLRSPRAYLTTIVTRLALDHLKSARATRERYVGPWLPEPVLTEGPPEAERSVALAESLTLAFLVLLDTLSPEERAVFLLREAFEHSYGEIASMLDSSAANCRQLFHRAKERLASGRARSAPSREGKGKVAERFVAAMRSGDRAELMQVLAGDVGFLSDGGGLVPAAKRPVLGRDAVVNLLLGIRRAASSAAIAAGKIQATVVDVNHEPAMLVRVDGQIDSVYVCSIVDDAIVGIRVVRNPDKLAYIGRQLGAIERGVPAPERSARPD